MQADINSLELEGLRNNFRIPNIAHLELLLYFSLETSVIFREVEHMVEVASGMASKDGFSSK
jgi:hypothetical protein